MNTRNIQFNATAFRGESSRRPAVVRLLIPLFLACLAAVFISIPTPAVAGDQVPFKGTLLGEIPANPGPPVPGTGGCVFNFPVPNHGNATHLGHFAGSSNLTTNNCDGSNFGTFNWVAANGDSISGNFFGQLIPTATPGIFDNVGTTIVTGGTGRFAGASGMFTGGGQVNFNTGTFAFPLQGTISSVGRN
jgi:hypothetical protein